MSSLSLEATLSLVPILFLLHMITKTMIARRTNQKTRPPLPPGPSPWPILGSFPEMWRNRPVGKWVLRLMDDFDADITCFRLGMNSHVVAVRSPEIAREFLKKNDLVFASRPVTMATRIVSRGYVSAGLSPWGGQWKKMRKVVISDAFSPSNIRWLLHHRNLEADNIIRFVYSQCSNTSKGELVNVRTAAKHYSCGVMRRMMFNMRHFGKGKDNGGPGFEEEEHVTALFTILSHIFSFSVSDYFPWLECLDLDGHKKAVVEAMGVIAKYHDPIVNDRIRHRRDCGTNMKPKDVLDILISLTDSNGNPLLSDEEIRAQVMEPFLTLDTPYTVTEWTLSEMLNKPEIMEKALEELDRVIGKDRLIQESDIPNLPYVTSCAKEALRLHPVGTFNLPHTSTADCTVAGYFIPKGSSVILHRTGLGHNPKVWEEPLRFNPGRHMVEEEGGCRVGLAEDQLQFVTFSTGRRGCTHVGLGSNIIIMLLGRILQGFSWEIPYGLNKIDMSECGSAHFKAQPLLALAKPRLNSSVYHSLLVESIHESR